MRKSMQYGPVSRWYLVGVSHLIFVLSAADRYVLSLLVEPIQRDTGMTDFEISLLAGLAFSLFYAICAIPIGRLIDGGNRTLILGIGILVWSAATMGAAFTSMFLGLFAARVFVAVGETTTSCAVGMVTDTFMDSKYLARVIAVVMLGGTIGSGIALGGGGFILDQFADVNRVMLPFGIEMAPWQVVLFVAGLPGLLIAALVFLTIRDPERRRVVFDAQGNRTRASFATFAKFLRDHKGAVTTHALGYSIWSIGDKSLAFWAPTYLVRAHDVTVSTSGYVFGMMAVGSTIVGNLTISWLVDRAARAGRLDAAVRVGRNAAVLGIAPIVLFPFMPTFTTALIMLVLALFTQAGYSTVVVAQQMLAPNQVRAQYTAMYLLTSNVIGGVIGMSLVALLSEHVFQDRNLVGFSIALVCGLATAVGAGILSGGLKYYRESMVRIGRKTESGAEVVDQRSDGMGTVTETFERGMHPSGSQ